MCAAEQGSAGSVVPATVWTHGVWSAPVPLRPSTFVDRPRLRVVLDAAFDTPVTAIVAPAGCGKTALVAAWSAGRDARPEDDGVEQGVHWVRATDTGQLCEHLLHAAGLGDGSLPAADEPALLAARVDRTADRLVAEAASPTRPCVIVVDDAQQLPPESVRLLDRLLTQAPTALRLVLLTRHDLTFLPVGLTLGGHLRQLRARDLLLAPDEARQLVHAHHPDAGDDDVLAVVEQTHGWAAAVVLASRTLSTARDPGYARLSLRSTEQPVLDYLLGEAFEGFPAALRTVLVSTCQEEQVTERVALALSGLARAPQLLADAAEEGLLVTAFRDPHDLAPPSWTYHPLLLELLRRRTSPTGPDWEELVAAHRRAATWFARDHDAAAAVRHARLTGDVDVVVGVLESFAPHLLSTGRADVVAEAVRSVPDEPRQAYPSLLALEALLHRVGGDVTSAKTVADVALRSLPPADDVTDLPRNLLADLAQLAVWEAKRGWLDGPDATRHARRALGCRHPHDQGSSSHDSAGLAPLRSAWLMLELAPLEAWQGDVEASALHVEEATRASRQLPHPGLVCASLAHRAILEMIDGAYQTGADTATACLEVARTSPLTSGLHLGRAHLALAWAAFQSLRLDDAEAALSAVEEHPEALDPLLAVYSRLLRVRLLAARGDVLGSGRLLASRADVPEHLPFFADRLTRVVRIQSAAMMNDLGTMWFEIDGMRTAGYADDVELWTAVTTGLEGHPGEAVERLDRLLAGTLRNGMTSAAAAVARVAFLQRSGDADALDRARSLVPDLLSRVALQRLLWILSLGTLFSPGFEELLAHEAGLPTGHPLAAEVVEVLRSSTTRPAVLPVAPEPSAGRATHHPHELSRRELEVLHELALGGSNGDIARALFVSENTVKTHLASIFRKLRVDRRVDALRASRELGLLRSPVAPHEPDAGWPDPGEPTTPSRS